MRVRMLAATTAVAALLLTGCTPAAESETEPPVAGESIATDDGAQDEAVEVEEEVVAEGPAGGVVYADPTSDATQITIGPDGFSPSPLRRREPPPEPRGSPSAWGLPPQQG